MNVKSGTRSLGEQKGQGEIEIEKNKGHVGSEGAKTDHICSRRLGMDGCR